MTEEDARTKWCPNITNGIVISAISAAIYKDDVLGKALEETKQTCIASDCMMWADDIVETQDENGDFTGYEAIGGHCGLVK